MREVDDSSRAAGPKRLARVVDSRTGPRPRPFQGMVEVASPSSPRGPPRPDPFSDRPAIGQDPNKMAPHDAIPRVPGDPARRGLLPEGTRRAAAGRASGRLQ